MTISKMRRRDERQHFVEDRLVASLANVLGRNVGQPKQVVRKASADAVARVGVPPAAIYALECYIWGGGLVPGCPPGTEWVGAFSKCFATPGWLRKFVVQ